MNISIQIKNTAASPPHDDGSSGTFNPVVPHSSSTPNDKKLKSAMTNRSSLSVAVPKSGGGGGGGMTADPQSPKHVTININDGNEQIQSMNHDDNHRSKKEGGGFFHSSKPVRHGKTRFKVLLIGAVKAGKSSIFKRIIDGTYQSKYTPTQKIDIGFKLVQLDQLYTIELWDIPANAVIEDLMKEVYMKGVDGALLVTDVTDLKTFQVIRRWTSSITEYSRNHALALLTFPAHDGKSFSTPLPFPVFLVANKLDSDKRMLKESEVIESAKTFRLCASFATSAARDRNITEALISMIGRMKEKELLEEGVKNGTIQLGDFDKDASTKKESLQRAPTIFSPRASTHHTNTSMTFTGPPPPPSLRSADEKTLSEKEATPRLPAVSLSSPNKKLSGGISEEKEEKKTATTPASNVRKTNLDTVPAAVDDDDEDDDGEDNDDDDEDGDDEKQVPSAVSPKTNSMSMLQKDAVS